jgi:hypothetical protein
MLSEDTKVDIRRHLDFPLAGLPYASPGSGAPNQGVDTRFASGMASYRYFQIWPLVEWRLDSLSAAEESRITGLAYGAVKVVAGVAAGDQVSVTLSGGGLGSPVTLTHVAASGDTPLGIVNALAVAGLGNATLLSAGFQVQAPWGTGPYAQSASPLPQVTFTNPQAFSVSTAFTGTTAIAVLSSGGPSPPQATVDATTSPPTVLNGFVPILNFLEAAVAGAHQNLDTIRADVWTARHDEIRQRIALYTWYRHRFAQFLWAKLGMPTGFGNTTLAVAI